MLTPMFLIVSSSVYPAIISGIQNKEMALMAEALAQLQEKNSKGDSSGYHANIPISDLFTESPSPTPTTAGPTSIIPSSSNSAGGGSNSNDNNFSTQAALSLTRASQTSNIVNSKAYYDISFRTSTAGTIKTVEIDFPPGTYVGAATLVEVVGIGAGTIAASGSTGTGMKITYTVTNEVNVPALTRIRIQLANINNPQDPSASYMVTITSKDAGNAIIDGPTATNAYDVRQIRTNDITFQAVTGEKIRNDAVTPDKLREDSVFLAWEDNTPGNFDILYRKGEPIFDQLTTDLSNTAGISSNPDIAVGAPLSGHSFAYVHLVWQDDSSGTGEIFYGRSKNGGATLDSVVNLSNDEFLSSDPVVAVNENNVYVVWENEGSEGQFNIIYRKSANNGLTFGAPQIMSSGGSLAFDVDPSIAADDGSVYVVWASGGVGEILYRRSANFGSTFSSISNLSNNVGSSTAPAIAASQSNVFVVWSDDTAGNSEILFRRSIDEGASFSSTENLSNNVGISTNPAVAALTNFVYVAWENERTAGSETVISLKNSIDSGNSFSSEQNISNFDGVGSTHNAINPDVTVSGTSVYVVWANEALSGNLEILYRRSTGPGTINFERTIDLSTNPGTSDSPTIAATFAG
jgi:hypothetical protein